MERAATELQKSYRKDVLFGFFLIPSFPFTFVSLLKTFHLGKMLILEQVAANLYQHYAWIQKLWEPMPFFSFAAPASLASIFFYLLAACSLVSLFALWSAWDKYIRYHTQKTRADNDALRDDFRGSQ